MKLKSIVGPVVLGHEQHRETNPVEVIIFRKFLETEGHVALLLYKIPVGNFVYQWERTKSCIIIHQGTHHSGLWCLRWDGSRFRLIQWTSKRIELFGGLR